MEEREDLDPRAGDGAQDLDGAPDAGPDGGPDGPRGPEGDAAGEISYDCSPWAAETRQMLAGLLVTRDVPHAWEGTVLVVRAADEEAVDALVDEVTDTARPRFPRDAELVAYEVSGWPAEAQNALVERLGDAGIPSAWDDDGDLVVMEAHAEAAEEILAGLAPDGEPSGGEQLDGMELHSRLDALFVAADRLRRDPADRSAARRAVPAVAAVEDVATPFGVEPADWVALRGTAGALSAAIRAAADGDGPTHDTGDGVPSVESVAAELVALLRAYL